MVMNIYIENNAPNKAPTGVWSGSERGIVTED